MNDKVYILGGLRSYIGVENGMYKHIPAEKLGAEVLKEVIDKYNISKPDYIIVTGLESGADDYITKPFSLAVLRARVNAQLRRSVRPARAEFGGFQFDFDRMEYRKNGQLLDLSKTEQKLLRILVVPDVDRFPGHIACSSASRSEIVVPMLVDGKVAAVLDIDSSRLNTFDEVDRLWLERIVAVLAAVV